MGPEGAAAPLVGGTGILPMERERAKPVEEGWQRLILVVVCCVVCCGCYKPVFATLLVEKVEIGPAKMANFSAFIIKMHH